VCLKIGRGRAGLSFRLVHNYGTDPFIAKGSDLSKKDDLKLAPSETDCGQWVQLSY
jgi:hypothetical protein